MSRIAPTPDPREQGLPVWAQNLLTTTRDYATHQAAIVAVKEQAITRLEQQVRDLSAENGPANSNTFIDRVDPDSGEEMEPLGLGREQRIRFETVGVTFYVHMDYGSGRLHVTSFESMVIRATGPCDLTIQGE